MPAAYALPGGKLYQPADYSGRFSGPVRVRYALANSLNVPAVQVLSMLGVGELLDAPARAGIRAPRSAAVILRPRPNARQRRGQPMGAREAYATLARGGAAVPLHLVAGRPAAGASIGDPAVLGAHHRHARGSARARQIVRRAAPCCRCRSRRR